jgi:hypothetical protein
MFSHKVERKMFISLLAKIACKKLGKTKILADKIQKYRSAIKGTV